MRSRLGIHASLQPAILEGGRFPQGATTVTSQGLPRSRDIAPVALSPLRHVDYLVFENFLFRFGSLLDKSHRARLECEDRTA
jgi:hypothetical protein